MKTLVYQSCPDIGAPDIVSRATDTVRAWAEQCGYDYELSGDDLFDLVPGDLRDRCFGQTPKIADLARLYRARAALDEGYDRVLWLDADILIFAPERLVLPAGIQHAFGREVWVQRDKMGHWKAYRHVHNAVCLFERGTPVLDFLIWQSEEIVSRQDKPSAPQLIGPKLLTALHNIAPFHLIESIGMISPPVMQDLLDSEGLNGGGPALDLHRRKQPEPLAAINLCTSLLGSVQDGINVTPELFEQVADQLLADQT